MINVNYAIMLARAAMLRDQAEQYQNMAGLVKSQVDSLIDCDDKSLRIARAAAAEISSDMNRTARELERLAASYSQAVHEYQRTQERISNFVKNGVSIIESGGGFGSRGGSGGSGGGVSGGGVGGGGGSAW